MSTINLDPLYSHAKNIGATAVGKFCGSPIVTLDQRAIDVDNALEIQRMVLQHVDGSVVELLPNEVVCPDGVIRKKTIAEVVGECFYAYTEPQDAKRLSLEEAKLASLAGKCITFRPDGRVGEGEFFLLYEEAA